MALGLDALGRDLLGGALAFVGALLLDPLLVAFGPLALVLPLGVGDGPRALAGAIPRQRVRASSSIALAPRAIPSGLVASVARRRR